MDKKFTPSDPLKGINDVKDLSPSKLTVEFIRQFARVYNYDHRLEHSLASVSPN